ncbi:MAG: hypothetical protein ACYS8W_18390 [Planctomycetota bacterium]|jgi:hypothetical protein
MKNNIKSLPLKLAVAVIGIFGVTIAACLLYRPVKIRYYASKYESSTDPAERIRPQPPYKEITLSTPMLNWVKV